MTPDAPTTPSLSVLAFRLANRETWPPGYVFEFYDQNKCAAALAFALWPDAFQQGVCVETLAQAFKISEQDVRDIFVIGERVGPTMPHHIVERINAHLERSRR